MPQVQDPTTPLVKRDLILAYESARRQDILIGSLYNPSGPKLKIKWTAYWKLLSNLRDKEAFSIGLVSSKATSFNIPKNLIYCFPGIEFTTPIFDSSERGPWQDPGRTLAEEGNDFSGKNDIEEKCSFDRLHVPQNLRWEHHDSTEDKKIEPTSGKSNIHVLHHGLNGRLDRNESSFVSLVL